MNHCQRRLHRAFTEGGGNPADPRQAENLAQFVRTQLLLLPPAVRRAVAAVLEAGERAYYEDVADVLSAREGRGVTSTAARKRVSRGLLMLERVIRDRAWEIAASTVPSGHKAA